MADDYVEDGGQATTDTGVETKPADTATETTGGSEIQVKTTEMNPEDVVPDVYELNVPDGSLLKTDYIEKVKTEAKALGLTNQEAQEYLESQHRAVSSYHEALVSNYEAEKTEWANQSKTDKEIGGDNFNQNVELANRVIKHFDKSGVFSEMLNKSGFGNHPEVLRIFTRIGKDMGEDSLIHASSHDNKEKNIEDILYNSKEG